MKKTIVPAILILVISSVLFLLVAKEYSNKRRVNNPVLNGKINETTEKEEDSDEPVVSGKRLMAEDVCIVVGNDADKKEITLRNVKGGDDKALGYDGTTKFLTKHGRSMTASELNIGDIVDISFTTYDSKLSEVKQSDSAWEYKNVTKFEIDEKGRTITIADELYRIAKNYVVASGNKKGKLLDVTGLDTITVKGIGKDVYSIQVEGGHGYIRVTNDSYFVGGWVEIGQDIITILTEGMLIPVREGTYDIKVTNKGYVGRETVTVKRDKETKLDLSKIDIEEVAIGHVKFVIYPEYAQLYVDGLMTDFEERV
ncbi:MAG: hypothetical protein Q4D29_08565, partial [Lachnospiraceae bacterium]|nr:hypothetical protein [Lachnospiraceae bacterium]